MDTSAALTDLNTDLNDGDNFTFTADEKTRAIEKAWRDKFVVEEVYDSSLTYLNTTQQYSLPTGVTNVIAIGQDFDADGFKTEISADGFLVIDGKLHIKDGYRDVLSHNKTLYLWCWKKLTTSDSISDERLQEYVLLLATYNTLRMLKGKKVNRFLKNDTSMAELLNYSNELWRDIQDYRRQHRVIPQEV
jgi:hypothetical protein